MTGGVILVLGSVGKNMGAGMTGGVAYVLDQDGLLPELYNSALVVHEALDEEDTVAVKQLIYQHLDKTESARAREILADWARFAPKFVKIRPRSAPPKMPGLVQMPAAMPASKL
jgi:glutamate synthase (NADPH/NADH) large chain/glutamate synthase (ferredoxin)